MIRFFIEVWKYNWEHHFFRILWFMTLSLLMVPFGFWQHPVIGMLWTLVALQYWGELAARMVIDDQHRLIMDQHKLIVDIRKSVEEAQKLVKQANNGQKSA